MFDVERLTLKIDDMRNVAYLFLFILLIACHSESPLILFPESHFRMDIDGKPVTLYTLSNRNGLTMQVTNWGARVVSLWIPDRQGNWDDIVLGYETIDRYLGSHVVWGATVGRFGNRIANGCFSLEKLISCLHRTTVNAYMEEIKVLIEWCGMSIQWLPIAFSFLIILKMGRKVFPGIFT